MATKRRDGVTWRGIDGDGVTTATVVSYSYWWALNNGGITPRAYRLQRDDVSFSLCAARSLLS